ncbi:MAG TPA: hypothetical protein VFL98_03455 [Candidatus Paceibacterota bacterium]|nr:hypothetical protein [Candidatus Paceibacterota bacterium]
MIVLQLFLPDGTPITDGSHAVMNLLIDVPSEAFECGDYPIEINGYPYRFRAIRKNAFLDDSGEVLDVIELVKKPN